MSFALGQLGPACRPHLGAIARQLKDGDAQVRRAAAAALGELGKVAAPLADAVRACMQDADGAVRTAAAQAFEKVRCGA